MKPNHFFFSTALVAFILGIVQLATGQVEIHLTEHTTSSNGTTYRLYADFNETANITSVFAPEAIYQDQWWPGLDPSDSNDDLPPNSIPSISFATDASNGFFQFALGQHYNTPSGIIPSLFQFYPDMAFDSWFTIGGAEGVSAGVQLIPGQADALNNFNNGGMFDTEGFADGGGWYTATSTPIYTDENGQILLAQLTVEEGASIDVVLSLIWRDAAAVSHVEIGLTASVGDTGAGCMDSVACNYDASATEVGECVFASSPCESCSGELDGTGTVILNDADGDEVCDSDEVLGCQNSAACNYNTSATDSGACSFAMGCDECAGNPTSGSGFVQDNDADDDGVCNDDEILGCTNSLACNYLIAATEDNGTCVLPVNCETCSGESDGSGTIVDNDQDEDGVCDMDEIVGCLDASACNYNAEATDDGGGCIYSSGCDYCSGDTDGSGSVLNGDIDGDSVCNSDEIEGCLDSTACNYNQFATDSSACEYAVGCAECSGADDGTGAIIANDDDEDGICNSDEISGCQDSNACNYNADATDDGVDCQYPTGCDSCSGPSDGSGVIIDNDADNDGVCDADEIVGCQDSTACNFNENATEFGDCTYPDTGYNCAGVCLNDFDGDGVCDGFEVSGCIYASACNYDAAATDDDGSCVFAASGLDCSGNCLFDVDADGVCDQSEVAGCLDDTACNYNASATEAGYCVYPDSGYDCNGDCIADADLDGICDAFEVDGCSDSGACNYDASATDDDGSCVFAASGLDCSGNCLFDVDADGVCDQSEVAGCLDDTACNYNASATEAGYCVYPDSGYDCNGDCIADADLDGICDAFEVDGCSDSGACNYDASATDDDGSCVFAASGLDCSGNCLFDVDADGVCDQSEVTGCLDDTACNYNASATEAGYCVYPDSGYDCNGDCIDDADADGICDAFEVTGCTEPLAINYNSEATEDDGSCVYGILGCTYSWATNYNPAATEDDGSCLTIAANCNNALACNFNEGSNDDIDCVFALTGLDCNGDCIADADADGICDAFELDGCSDSGACNYDAAATDDDGSCVFAASGLDCSGNCLFDVDADGVCDQSEVAGCLDDTACNYNASATEAGYCVYPDSGYDCNGDCIADADARWNLRRV